MYQHRQGHPVPHQHQHLFPDHLRHCVICFVFVYVSVPWDCHNHLHVLYQMCHLQHSEMSHCSLPNRQNQQLMLILEVRNKHCFTTCLFFFYKSMITNKTDGLRELCNQNKHKFQRSQSKALHNNSINQFLIFQNCDQIVTRKTKGWSRHTLTVS